MTESEPGFQSLPPEYQRVIQLAQEHHNIAITPLQELVGGWSGAAIYLVSVISADSGRVEHLVLKLDRKRPMFTSDEISRHKIVLSKSPPDFARQHIPEIFYDQVEAENARAIFYAIAGQSLLNFRTLSKHRRQSQIETLFKTTNYYLLQEWNTGLAFEPVSHPQTLLKRWLGFRLKPGQNIETFLREACRIHPDNSGFFCHLANGGSGGGINLIVRSWMPTQTRDDSIKKYIRCLAAGAIARLVLQTLPRWHA